MNHRLPVLVISCWLPTVVACSDAEATRSANNAAPLPPLASLEDLDPNPDILEVALRAHPAEKVYPGAKPSEVWTYSGTVPGPLLEAKVGDELIVHFQNDLPEPTTIHWHGLRLPATMDGSPAMQSPIEPGGTFEYRFPLKDAGLFWFHPHVRSLVQVEKGLYGTILVRGDQEPAADGETVLVLDDVNVNPDGSFPEYLDDETKMMGREGNVLLINGEASPEISLQRGALERLRLVNVANGRFFNLRLENHTFRVIGTDGGLLPQPWDTELLLLAPGERYDVVLIPSGEPDQRLVLWNEPYERGHHSGEESPAPLASVRLSSGAALDGRALPNQFADIEALPAGAVDLPITLAEAFDSQGELIFTVNGQAYPNVSPVSVSEGSVRVLGVDNQSDMDHPFHLHGFFFQQLGAERLANKDTIIVPAKERVDLVARFDELGKWMYHCHILEHADGGMMGEIHVE